LAANGIIGNINLNQIKEDFFSELEKVEYKNEDEAEDYKMAFYHRFELVSDQEIPEELVTKLLKVYGYDKGNHEATMQEQTHDFINKADDKGQLAKIPKVYFNLPVEVGSNEKLKNKLENDGIDISGNQVYMIGMEKIEGDDLITHTYKSILRDKGFDEEQIKDMKFEQLEQSVGLYLKGGFNIPGGKGKDLAAKHFEILQVSRENDQKIVELLKQIDFQLPKEVFTKLDNTIKTLHDNNIYHRELHTRNIMFDYDESGAIKDTWLIDFASAHKFETKPVDPYNDDNGKYIEDDYYQKFRVFTKSQAERESEGDDRFLNEMKDLLVSVKKRQETNPQAKAKYQELVDEINEILDYEEDAQQITKEVGREFRFYSATQVSDNYAAKQLEVAMMEDFANEHSDKITKEDIYNYYEEERLNPKQTSAIHLSLIHISEPTRPY